MIKTIELDLSRLKNFAGKLVPGVLLEIKLIELYRLNYFKTEPIEPFTTYVLDHIYSNTLPKNYDDILNFYKERDYLTIVFNFLSLIEHVILSKLVDEIDIVNIWFKEYVDEEKLIVRFEYEVCDEFTQE